MTTTRVAPLATLAGAIYRKSTRSSAGRSPLKPGR